MRRMKTCCCGRSASFSHFGFNCEVSENWDICPEPCTQVPQQTGSGNCDAGAADKQNCQSTCERKWWMQNNFGSTNGMSLGVELPGLSAGMTYFWRPKPFNKLAIKHFRFHRLEVNVFLLLNCWNKACG